jgi:predicted  nucleic acid-binding Zn-ribbon protein
LSGSLPTKEQPEGLTDKRKCRRLLGNATTPSNIDADSIFRHVTDLETKVKRLEKEAIDAKNRADAAEKKLGALKDLL